MDILREPDKDSIQENPEKKSNQTFSSDIRRGLSSSEKFIPCIYFYDKAGSELFEEITRLPEYYLTRTETKILEQYADEIAGLFPANTSLVELGSGSSIKTQILIEAFLAKQDTLEYIPIDVSENILEESAETLDRKYPRLKVTPVKARYKEGIDLIEDRQHNPKLILWLGSSIGNFGKPEAIDFFKHLCSQLPSWDRLLVGIDMIKDRSILELAYNDSAGVTARFNLNLLTRVNRELGGNFCIDGFRHHAEFNEQKGCIEISIQSCRKQTVHISSLGLDVQFKKGEWIHTEDSHKYSLAEISLLARRAGLQLKNQWFDQKQWFSLNMFLTKASPPPPLDLR
jgi:L-histidine Nalpha-methyltransferase